MGLVSIVKYFVYFRVAAVIDKLKEKFEFPGLIIMSLKNLINPCLLQTIKVRKRFA